MGLGHDSHGLGLNISKKIAKSLGGDLLYVRMPVGCRFDFQFHAKVIESNILTSLEYEFLQASYGFGSELGSAKMKINNSKVVPFYCDRENLGTGTDKVTILIAEDSEICQEVLRGQIYELDLKEKTEFFVSGDQVLERAIKLIDEYKDDPQPIRLMLLDNQMPRKTGSQVVAELKAYIKSVNETREIKLVEPKFAIVSAFMNRNYSEYLMKHGVDFTFEKPLQKEELKEVLDMALKSQ